MPIAAGRGIVEVIVVTTAQRQFGRHGHGVLKVGVVKVLEILEGSRIASVVVRSALSGGEDSRQAVHDHHTGLGRQHQLRHHRCHSRE